MVPAYHFPRSLPFVLRGRRADVRLNCRLSRLITLILLVLGFSAGEGSTFRIILPRRYDNGVK